MTTFIELETRNDGQILLGIDSPLSIIPDKTSRRAIWVSRTLLDGRIETKETWDQVRDRLIRAGLLVTL